VAAAFVLLATGHAVIYSFGAFFEPLAREFGAEQGSVSLVFSITFFLSVSLGPVTGALTDRFGPRILCGLAAIGFLIGLGLASRATALWQVYVTYSLFAGVAFAAVLIPTISTVQRWFVRRRAGVTGLAISGNGVGTVIGPAATSWLILQLDWRAAYLITGVVTAALTALAGWFLLRSPADIGLAPDGGKASPPAAGQRSHRATTDRTVREAIRSPEFAWLYLAVLFGGLPIFEVLAHIIPYARDAGVDPTTASLALGALGAGGIFGRLALGPLADRWGSRRAYGLIFGGVAVLMLVWLILPVRQTWALLLFGIVYGVAIGGFSALGPVIVADYFGTTYISGTLGSLYTGFGLSSLIGPWIAGVLYDRIGSYQPAIVVGAVTALIGAAAIFRLRDPQRTGNPAASTGPDLLASADPRRHRAG
jgi:MFS family permease